MKPSTPAQITTAAFILGFFTIPLAAVIPDHTLLAQSAPSGQNRPAPANSGANSPALHEDPRGRPAVDLIGRDVVGANATKIGRLNDLIIDATSGQILYGLVDAAGAGRGLRAVPFDLLLPELADNALRFSLNTDEAAWDRAPRLDKKQIDSFAGDSVLRQNIHRHFAQQPPVPPRQAAQRLFLATALAGKDLRQGDATAGKIEAVIVNLPARQAAALFAPRKGFVETDAKFLLPLALLSTKDGAKDFEVTLNHQDFLNAPVSTDGAWAIAGTVRMPYLWPAYGTTATPLAGSSVPPPAPHIRNPGPSASLPSVEEIQKALLSDPNTWSTQVRLVVVRDRLALQGTVNSEDERRRIETRVAQAAGAWPIDNQLRIAGETTR
jgi:hypothetical protein